MERKFKFSIVPANELDDSQKAGTAAEIVNEDLQILSMSKKITFSIGQIEDEINNEIARAGISPIGVDIQAKTQDEADMLNPKIISMDAYRARKERIKANIKRNIKANDAYVPKQEQGKEGFRRAA